MGGRLYSQQTIRANDNSGRQVVVRIEFDRTNPTAAQLVAAAHATEIVQGWASSSYGQSMAAQIGRAPGPLSFFSFSTLDVMTIVIDTTDQDIHATTNGWDEFNPFNSGFGNPALVNPQTPIFAIGASMVDHVTFYAAAPPQGASWVLPYELDTNWANFVPDSLKQQVAASGNVLGVYVNADHTFGVAPRVTAGGLGTGLGNELGDIAYALRPDIRRGDTNTYSIAQENNAMIATGLGLGTRATTPNDAYTIFLDIEGTGLRVPISGFVGANNPANANAESFSSDVLGEGGFFAAMGISDDAAHGDFINALRSSVASDGIPTTGSFTLSGGDIQRLPPAPTFMDFLGEFFTPTALEGLGIPSDANVQLTTYSVDGSANFSAINCTFLVQAQGINRHFQVRIGTGYFESESIVLADGTVEPVLNGNGSFSSAAVIFPRKSGRGLRDPALGLGR
jgi:hypothetical protein